jgi:hypothetical protein
MFFAPMASLLFSSIRLAVPFLWQVNPESIGLLTEAAFGKNKRFGRILKLSPSARLT